MVFSKMLNFFGLPIQIQPATLGRWIEAIDRLFLKKNKILLFIKKISFDGFYPILVAL